MFRILMECEYLYLSVLDHGWGGRMDLCNIFVLCLVWGVVKWQLVAVCCCIQLLIINAIDCFVFSVGEDDSCTEYVLLVN